MKDWRKDDRKGENGTKTMALESNKKKGSGLWRQLDKERTRDETRVSGGTERGGGLQRKMTKIWLKHSF